jgi:alpha-N-arabinofuranosidase
MPRCLIKPLLLFFLAIQVPASAQTNLSIYSDQLNNSFQNWSWGSNNFSSTALVHSGTYAISYNDVAWDAISFEHADFNPAPYTNLNFWINGGAGGGQILQIYVQYNHQNSSGAAYQLPVLAANSWRQFFIPFSALGVAGVTNISRMNLQLTAGGTTNAFYLDDVNLTLIPPSLVHLKIDANQTLRTADARWFGLNAAIWDSYYDTPTTVSLLNQLGTRIVRLPGGSASDAYHWATATDATRFVNFVHVITNASVNAQAITTVNYGSGSAQEAAAWVRSANVTNHLSFKYWEIGNECYGTWETDTNVNAHDGYTYAVRAASYFAQMKAVDPTIKIGVPVVTGENNNINGYTNHPVYNARTGQTNYGWTPVVLSTLKSLGVTPDFLIYHVYPEYLVDNDQSLLQAAMNWAPDAADLRQQITDYFGSGGTNIELLCTENNAESANQGRQSTSIVNGLYLADSLAQLMKTEFNSYVWWDLRNGQDTGGDFDASLYGWRSYGDLGIVGNLNTCYPTFYTYKLMQFFARPGDTVLNSSSDYSTLLPVYSTRKADGSLAVLVINKDNATTYSTQLALTNFISWTNATVRSFGIVQDEATRTNSIIPGAQDIATNNLAITSTNFTTTFPPYSVTLLLIPPAAPQLTMQSIVNGQSVVQLQGQANVRYVVQSSTNFTTWIPVATNTLAGATWNLTNNLSAPMQLWRAVWLPQ